ncbi:hypothetical protein MGMO_171c00030 [Methyloglobulus morosus KoM1]|uniref:Uncharacterized protein n=1 Tax=Methyloglobulus morosus KoM1 TaxID=1116472 RepID=V5DID6_9GAMM|nr:hypothetical protein MGMO_171c00030 [Methyloglobulus morosus KoM1]
MVNVSGYLKKFHCPMNFVELLLFVFQARIMSRRIQNVATFFKYLKNQLSY